MKLARIEFHDDGGCLVASASGEIDISNAAAMYDAIVAAIPDQATAIVLDLTDVTYLGSAGLRLVFQLYERSGSRGLTLRLVVPEHSPASETLRLVGVGDYVPTSATLEAAVRLDCD
jgi:anti-anti-sigma factor